MKKLNFAPIIQDYMAKRGLNQSQLANNAGISGPGLNTILKGHNQVNLVRLQKIAKALNVDMWKLVKAAEGK